MFIDNRRRRTRNALLMTFGAIAMIVGACVAGYSFSRAKTKEEMQNKAQEQATSSLRIPVTTPTPTTDGKMAMGLLNNATLQGDAVLTIQYQYALCRHTVEDEVSEGLDGKTETDLLTDYPGATIVEFDAEHAIISVPIDMYCPEHYILKSVEGVLEIHRTVPGKEETSVERKLDDVSAPADPALETGIVFDSLEDIEEYLENMES